jgi:hypothetical protein
MHVALVSTYTHPFALGLRYISSCLKTAGHRVTVFFMSSRRDTANQTMRRPRSTTSWRASGTAI